MPDQRISSAPIIVLKFGGSVLHNEDSLGLAVHEIYRWRRDGYKVVAVVSAFKGETEALIDQCERVARDASSHAQAAFVGLGEAKSASLLGLLLDRSGIPARVLSPAAIGLLCTGDSLNSLPVDVNTGAIDCGLDEDGVVVLPGFTGIDEQGRGVTLGRGGSDSTAVFIAGKLGAQRCRLIKDVHGLYESDPNCAGSPAPARYANANYEDALNTDGSIIQHKSVQLARSLGVEIELGRFNSGSPSVIGDHPKSLRPEAERTRALKIAVCGLGTVGGGVVRALQQLTDRFEIVGAGARSPQKHTDLIPIVGEICSDPLALAECDADVVLELIGGIEPARSLIESALRRRKHVVTANKELIAEHGHELLALADEHGVKLHFSASVGGSLPVLEHLRANEAVAVSGVLNGTSQFVLRSIARGVPYEDAVNEAQRLGYAEADPSRDLDGRDALDKLRVIALQQGWHGYEIEFPACDPESILPGSGLVCQFGQVNPLRASVRQEPVECDADLASLGDSENLVTITREHGDPIVLRGHGAGRWATTVSVVGDLLELSRTVASCRIDQTTTLEEVACA